METRKKEPCKSCKAPIFWTISADSGRPNPIDWEPVANGNIVVVDGKAVYLKGDLWESMTEGPRYVSHFATCKDADKWRKTKTNTELKAEKKKSAK